MTTNPSIWRIEGAEIVEQPTMKEPDKFPTLSERFRNSGEWSQYNKHIATLRRYTHELPDSLQGKDLTEGIDFKLQLQWLDDINNKWFDCFPVETKYISIDKTRMIALPISQPEQPISEEGKEVELMNCPFCGGRSIIEQTGNKQLTIKCTECTVQRTQKVLRYSLDWLRTTMISQWNTRTPSREAVEERNNFAISFACWALYDPQAQSYLSAGITALGLLEKYLGRPYISTNTNQQ